MDYPNRHANHILENLSDIYLRNNLPEDWVLNQFHVDYGTDYNCEITRDNNVVGINFTIQLKAKEKDNNKDFIIIEKIKRSTINRWLNRLEPTMLVVFINSEKQAYWLWFEENTVDLTKKNKEFQIKISRQNKFSEINYDEIREKLEYIFSQRYKLYQLPYRNNNLYEELFWDKFLNKQYEQALFLSRDIINKDAILENAISICYYEKFQYKEALINISKALESFNKDSILLFTKASILTEMGIATHDNSKIKNAIEIYNYLIEKDKSSDSLFFNYANALCGLGLLEEAQANYIKCLKLNPNNAQAWKNLGSIYHLEELFEKELQCYECALLINPNLQEALYSKGFILFKEFKKCEEGLDFMLKSISITDDFEIRFPRAYYWIAEAFLFLKKYEDAKNFNKKSLYVESNNDLYLKQEEKINIAILGSLQGDCC